MKTILVPTDFSPVALNAAYYAAEIASLTEARIILLHVYAIPAIPSETMVILPMTQLEEGSLEVLDSIKGELQQKHNGKLKIECRTLGGLPSLEIDAFAKESNADLIVMGMLGAGYLTEKLVGSVTSTLLMRAKCPVLAIHKNIKFKSLKKILLACDYSEIQNKTILGPLKELAGMFKSHIYILNVAKDTETLPTADQAAAGIKLNHSLEAFDHSFHSWINEDIIDGLNQFAETNMIDLVVMVPHRHNLLQRIFHEPNTKRMAFHTSTPLLALH